MSKFKLRLGVSKETSSEVVSLDDLGFTENEWQGMTHQQQKSELQNYVDNMPDQPYWLIESFESL